MPLPQRTLAGLAAALLLSLSAAAAAQPSPHEFVQETVDDLLQVLARKDAMTDAQLEDAIRGQLVPLVHRNFLVAQVMGSKNYRAASKKQRSRFAEKFVEDLLLTYARSIREFEFQEVRVLPPSKPVKGKRASVGMQVRTATQDVELVYDMFLTKGGWKLINLRVAGADVVTIFRNQFAAALIEADGDIDRVIRDWRTASDLGS